MTNKKYPGYPQYVIITLPKCGTKSMNKCFTTLGYKVFDCPQLNAYWEKFHKYGKQEISFAEFATIFEENEYDVIIEPSALYWHEMAKHWPKTKFIQLTREIEGWCKSVVSFCGVVSDIPKGALLDHYHYQSPMISPTAHNAFVKGFGPYVPYSVGCDIFLHPNASSENVEIWPAMTARKYRMFHADVTLHAPKDRTLFNYNCIEDGWPKLREFLELPPGPEGEKFPHENKLANSEAFVKSLFDEVGNEYNDLVDNEVIEYMKRNGYHCKKIKPESPETKDTQSKDESKNGTSM